MKKLQKNKFHVLGLLGTSSVITILMLTVLSVNIVSAEDAQSGITVQKTNEPPSVGQTVIKAVEGKFRVGPTVRIRPLNDVINKSSDGIIEIYLENPGINDVPLTAEIHITVPSGINVYGQGFGDAQAAGVLYAKMVVPPGVVRTAYINIKAEKTGNYYAQLSGLYYPGENKDNYQPLSFTYPFIVYETSPDPKRSMLTNPEQIPGGGGDIWNDKIISAIIVAAIAGLIGLVYKIFEIKYQHKLETESRISKSKVTEKDGKITESETSETKTTENK
jgi:hypothetical protein